MMRPSVQLTALLTLSLVLAACSDQTSSTAGLNSAQQVQLLAVSAPSAVFDSTSKWDTGFSGRIVLDNPTASAIKGWTLKFKFSGNAAAGSSVWGAGGAISVVAGVYTVTPNTWGGDTIPAGGSVTVLYDGTGALTGVASCTLNGADCAGGTPPPPPSGGDTTPPTVALSAAPGSVTSAGTVTLSATASDNVGVNRVEFYANGTLLGTDSSAPFEASEAVSSAQNGSRAYSAKAFDAAGNNATSSAAVTINIATTPGGPVTPPAGGIKRVAYFTQWGIYGRNYNVKNIDTSGTAAALTHINYAFGNVYNVNGSYKCDIVTRAETGNGDGGDAFADYGKSFGTDVSVDGVADVWSQPLKGSFNQLKKLKAKYPALRVLISLGGWTWSRNFSAAASTDASRRALVSSCIDLYIRGNLPVSSNGAGGVAAAAGVFDGIDIDWEYPGGGGLPTNGASVADKQNFTLLLQEFRRQLDALRPGYLLTLAAPSNPATIANQDPAAYQNAIDWINLMAYDFRGAWDATGPTNFHSNLYPSPNDPGTGASKTYSVDTAVQAFLAAGLPASKLVVGLPMYGRGWTGVAGGNNGLYQTATGPAHGTYEAGYEDYKVLKNAPGTVYRDPVTKQLWKYDGSTFWSYDDPEVIATKTAYIKSKGLGGAMLWSLDGDDAQGTLAKAVATGLK